MGYVNIGLAGVLTGAAYSLIAVSITLMFRSTGVLSFAHAAFAMVGAYVYADLAGTQGWNPMLAVAAALAITVTYGVIVERVAIRPVAGGSSVMKLIVTLGVLSLTTGLVLMRYGFEPTNAPLLLPQGGIRLGEVAVTYQQLAILVVAGAAAAGLGWFLKATRFGVAVRAVAQDRSTARLMGVSLNHVARFNWSLGALLAGLAGILVAPLAVMTVANFPILLVKALTASLFGGLMSLPLTFAGGLVVGVVEGITTMQTNAPGARELAVLALVLILLFARRSWATDVDEQAGFEQTGRPWPAFLQPVSALAGRAGRLAGPVLVPLVVIAAAGGFALAATDEFWGFVGATALVFALQSLSLVLLVGWGGQVSLMHGAYVGIGAFATAYFVSNGMPLEVAIPLAAFGAVLLGGIAGFPALRLSGLQFAIASLAFAGAASQWLFRNPAIPRSLPRGELFGIDLFNSSSLFLVMVPVTALLFLLVWNVQRSSFGALLLASRDAPSTVSHFGASPRATRMAAFLLASFIAGIGGAFYGLLLTGFNPANFGLVLSISLLLYAVIGGISSLAGPIFAALVFGVLPQVLQSEAGTSASAWPEILSGVVVIALAASRPAGLASLLPGGRTTGGGPRLRFSRFEAAEVFRQNGASQSVSKDTDPTAGADPREVAV